MSSELNGKVALVTGASRGLGEGAARALAAAGAAVMLVARDGALAGNVARDIATKGGRAEALSCDVSDYAAVEKIVAETKARLGGIDILINNAGVIDPIAEVATSDPAAWAQNISINLIGAYHVVRAVLPGMLARGGGSIVNISSGAAYRPLEGWSAYCAGKAGLAMLTKSITLETAGRGHPHLRLLAGHHRYRHAGEDPRVRHEHDQPYPARRSLAGRACGPRVAALVQPGHR